MWSDETAITIPEGPRVIDVFAGNGAPSGPNCTLFSGVDRLSDSLWDRSGSGSRIRRMRQCSVLSRELWIEIFGKSWSRAIERKGPCLYVCTDGSARACGVGDCTCIVPTLGDPRETYLAGIDRIPLARPPWTVGRPRPRIKKFPFSAPGTCHIVLFGPLANGRILKRLHARSAC